MANALGTKSAETAERLLKKFGGLGVYSFTAVASWDGITQPPPVPALTEIPITTYPDKATSGEIQSGIVLAKDVIFLVSAKELGIVPKSGQNVTFNSLAYEFKIDLPIYGGQNIALHRLVCSIA